MDFNTTLNRFGLVKKSNR